MRFYLSYYQTLFIFSLDKSWEKNHTVIDLYIAPKLLSTESFRILESQGPDLRTLVCEASWSGPAQPQLSVACHCGQVFSEVFIFILVTKEFFHLRA